MCDTLVAFTILFHFFLGRAAVGATKPRRGPIIRNDITLISILIFDCRQLKFGLRFGLLFFLAVAVYHYTLHLLEHAFHLLFFGIRMYFSLLTSSLCILISEHQVEMIAPPVLRFAYRSARTFASCGAGLHLPVRYLWRLSSIDDHELRAHLQQGLALLLQVADGAFIDLELLIDFVDAICNSTAILTFRFRS